MPFSLLSAFVALASGTTALLLAAHYPLASPWAMGGTVGVIAVAFGYPGSWLLLPAVLPVAGLAPWTGWITFEELDILVLASAAGAYARAAWLQRTRPHGPAHPAGLGKPGPTAWLLPACFALSLMFAMWRGFADAGGMRLGWFQGYHEPMNSVRLAKGFFLALVLLPLWQMALQQNASRAQTLLGRSLVAGLVLVGLATVWERLAFTGLTDFSSDYRTTGLFWEMHVGGATLDGFLALTVPFAIHELVHARRIGRSLAAAAVLALATYASLTTFSRAVYLAVPVALAVFAYLHNARSARASDVLFSQPPVANGAQAAGGSVPVPGPRETVLWVAGFGAGAAWMFQTSGYRGMAALLGATALLLPLAAAMRGFSTQQYRGGCAMGTLLVALGAVAFWAIPRSVYVSWSLAALLTLVALVRARSMDGRSQLAGTVALGGFIAVVAGTAAIAKHWGEFPGLMGAVPVVLALVAAGWVAARSHRQLWPDTWRWHISTVALMAVAAATIGVLSGGAYMGGRFSTGERDLQNRFDHWHLGSYQLMNGADWILGKGLGRFPANYMLAGPLESRPGDYRLKAEGDNAFLTLTGGLHTSGWGEIFRVTQRISEPGSKTVVRARVRAAQDVVLHFEVCEKHLLYGQACAGRDIGVKAAPGVWQSLSAELQGEATPLRGSWYAPRLIAFSVAMDSRGARADIDDVSLATADGRALLANSDFSQGMAHWFFSSDKNHLPWHIKNLALNVWFEQGAVGTLLLVWMVGLAVWRTSFGLARDQPLAPALAAALVAFCAVGLFDSLIDAPRLAWLFYLLLGVALLLPRKFAGTAAARTTHSGLVAAVICALFLVGLAQPGPAVAADATTAVAPVLRVGPNRAIRSISQASREARDGAVIEVDAGEYAGDVAVWTQIGLTLRAVGGRVRLVANGVAAERKAIWVVRGDHMVVEGFDFTGARVPDRNGAGIRLERGKLLVRNCKFLGNENGILTGNDPLTELEIEDSEFGHNGHGDGMSHNLYAGAIARLSVTGSHLHHALSGHLLKSRAAVNDIRYNRLADGPGGRASYELEFSNGGVAYVVGNTIEQGELTENPHLISYAAEGYRWQSNALYLVHNTLVDRRRAGGVLLRVSPGKATVVAVNNLILGGGRLDGGDGADVRNNLQAGWNAFDAAFPDDYYPRDNAGLAGKLGAVPAGANGELLQPQAQFRRPMGVQALKSRPHNPGAVQTRQPPANP